MVTLFICFLACLTASLLIYVMVVCLPAAYRLDLAVARKTDTPMQHMQNHVRFYATDMLFWVLFIAGTVAFLFGLAFPKYM